MLQAQKQLVTSCDELHVTLASSSSGKLWKSCVVSSMCCFFPIWFAMVRHGSPWFAMVRHDLGQLFHDLHNLDLRHLAGWISDFKGTSQYDNMIDLKYIEI